MKNFNPPHPIDVRDALQRLGERIAIARKAAEWRQSDLADHAGLGRSTIIEIEKGSPYVAMGNYMAALWALNILDDIEKIAVLESASHRLMASRLPKRVRHGQKS